MAPDRDRIEEVISKTIVAVTLAYLAIIAVTCPCAKSKENPDGALYKCHLSSLYAGSVIVILNLMYFNGFRVLSYV